MDIRLDLSRVIIEGLINNRLTKAKLAEAAGMKPSQLTPILKGERNFTCDVAGRIAYALGIHLQLVARENFTTQRHSFSTSSDIVTKEGTSHGETKIQILTQDVRSCG